MLLAIENVQLYLFFFYYSELIKLYTLSEDQAY